MWKNLLNGCLIFSFCPERHTFCNYTGRCLPHGEHCCPRGTHLLFIIVVNVFIYCIYLNKPTSNKLGHTWAPILKAEKGTCNKCPASNKHPAPLPPPTPKIDKVLIRDFPQDRVFSEYIETLLCYIFTCCYYYLWFCCKINMCPASNEHPGWLIE